MEEFGWTPKQINEISYKKIQEILIIKNAQTSERNRKSAIESFKNSVARGEGRRYREV